MTVDPDVYTLAQKFVIALIEDMGEDAFDSRKRSHRDALIQEAAEAIQQAVEQECEAIRKELQG